MNQLTDNELLDELKRRFDGNRKTLNELQLLTGQLVTLNDKLSQSEKMKSNFLSNIRNEIVNPFSSIIGLSRQILTVDKHDWKRVISMVSIIYAEAFSLDFQLKNIFAAAEIEAGELQPEWFEVSIEGLVNDMIMEFQHKIHKKQIHVVETSSENEVQVITDPGKLKLIIMNLLNNAIDYSPAQTTITIQTSYDAHFFTIEVHDEGKGISKEHQDKIFDRFTRLDPSINSHNQGHGLGLSVVKALTDFMEGSIKVKSQKGKGSVFTVKLPNKKGVEKTLGLSDGDEMFFSDEEF